MAAEIMLQNYINNEWLTPGNNELLDVTNPATADVLARVPLSLAAEVDTAAQAAASALDDWRRTPPTERIQYLFKLKQLLEDNLDDISRTITMECGEND